MIDINALPLVLCGPIVRCVTRESATVMLVLKEAQEVSLKVYDPNDKDAVLMEGRCNTVPLGTHLHYCLVTARSLGHVEPNRTCAYDVVFSDGKTLTTDGVLVRGIAVKRKRGFYRKRQYTFVVPPDNPSELRFIHASCRKPHGNGQDGMSLVDEQIEKAVLGKVARPHMLLLTGDQIYADDVDGDLLARIQLVMASLMGSAELDSLRDPRLERGSRAGYIAKAGMTSGAADNHLVTLAEFYGMYLMAWSPVLWDAIKEPVPDALEDFETGVECARRAMANIPTYMIFDDHEVTDDWFIRDLWTLDVLESKRGRRILRNALSAYALFQHAGNVPELFEEGKPGGLLLKELEGFDGAGAQEKYDTIEQHVGLVQAGAPLTEDTGGRVEWGWRLSVGQWEIVALDTRSRREFSTSGVSLMSRADIDRWLGAESDDPGLTIVLSAAPVLGVAVMEKVQGKLAQYWKDGALKWDDEPWLRSPTYDHLIDTLLERRAVVVLSGDVHYGFSALAKAENPTGKEKKIVNFTSSALKNQSKALLNAIVRALIGGSGLEAAGGEPPEGLVTIDLETQKRSVEGWTLKEDILVGDEGAPEQVELKLLHSDSPIEGLEAATHNERSAIVPWTNIGIVHFDEDNGEGVVVQTLQYWKNNGTQDNRRDRAFFDHKALAASHELTLARAIDTWIASGRLPAGAMVIVPSKEEASAGLARLEMVEAGDGQDEGSLEALRALAHWVYGNRFACARAALAAELAGFDIGRVSGWISKAGRSKDLTRHGLRPLGGWLEAMKACARATWRVLEADGTFKGTAVLVDGGAFDPDWEGRVLALTCAHVCSGSAENAMHAKKPVSPSNARLRFDPAPNIQESGAEIKVVREVWSGQIDQLDATLLEVDQVPSWAKPVPVSRKETKKGGRVFLLGYPEGKPLTVSTEDNEIEDIEGAKLQYNIGSAPGSSGGPVFELDEYGLCAIHRGHEGGDKQAVLLELITEYAEEAFIENTPSVTLQPEQPPLSSTPEVPTSVPVPTPVTTTTSTDNARYNSAYAVVIGVGADLPQTVTDAEQIANHLTDPMRCAYPVENVRLLSSAQATLDGIRGALAWLAQVTQGKTDATAMVYFSGHGITGEKGSFLVPFGRDDLNLAGTSLNSTEFNQALDAVKTDRLIVMLDCCFAAAQTKNAPKGASLSAEVLEELSSGSGRVVLASSKKNEVSQILPGAAMSVFTQAIIEGLSGRGSFEDDGFVRVLPLALWVNRRVPDLTDDAQNPVLKLSGLSHDFAIGWYAGGEKTAKSLSWETDGKFIDVPLPENQAQFAIALGENEAGHVGQMLQLSLERDELLDNLGSLNEAQFEQVVFLGNIPDAMLREVRAFQNRQAIHLARDFINRKRLPELAAHINKAANTQMVDPNAADRTSILAALQNLIPGQFSDVMFRSGVDSRVSNHDLWLRAIDVIGYCERKDSLEELRDLIQQAMGY